MKYIYAFEEGNKEMRSLLGGKGANLAEMTKIGLSVPRGFTITTEACLKYYQDKQLSIAYLLDELDQKLSELEAKTNKRLGSLTNPLLLSVRSGAKFSMPGMMDSILNVGLNDDIVEALIKKTNNPRFVYDSYRRLIQMFAEVVMNYPHSLFENILDKVKGKKGVKDDLDLNEVDLKKICAEYKKLYLELVKKPFPNSPKEQLIACIIAVFKSWNNERAFTYRKLNNIPHDLGTAVNIQEMVYGNYGENSATGVAFTRNPATGEKMLYGEYLINAQGEDVVAGIRTPERIIKLGELMPNVYQELTKIAFLLEDYYLDMQDIEFTIEEGKLFILQTRNAKRTAKASVKVAVDLVEEGKIDKKEALKRIDPEQLNQLLHPTFEEQALKKAVVISKGLAASPGAAFGQIYFNAKDVVLTKQKGVKEVILVRMETSPEDIDGMHQANGILTRRGGMTSHAAVVARSMGKSCIVGCSELTIDESQKTLTFTKGMVFREGDYLSIDGSTGYIYGEKIKTVTAPLFSEFKTLISWADEVRSLKVMVNADTKEDAKLALSFGAEGIGLCRTEHMFFEKDRILAFREMIIAKDKETRAKALKTLLPIQRQDFIDLFKIMNGLPITIRYLDPPLNEFLPKLDNEINLLANTLKIEEDVLKNQIKSLEEANPMMGHRGCRLYISYPEILIMQTKAIVEAAILVKKEGLAVNLELMIPLVSDIAELTYIIDIIKKEANKIFKETNLSLDYKIGSMIELPRACLIADQIASKVDFFSFGTNDLTQMTYGFSRDDVERFLVDYYHKDIFSFDPFIKLDQIGVGNLIKIGIEKGKKVNFNLKIGVCGEHGGEPSNIEFFNQIGVDYISSSPYRILIAKLASALANLKN